jgi:hypothetical protein
MSEQDIRSEQDLIRACAAQDPDWAARCIGDYVTTILAAAPPLSVEQRTRLAELLRPAREAVVKARLAELGDA